MKIRSQDLAKNLQHKLHPIYLITGDETLLVNEAYDAIRNACYQAGYQERLRFQVDAHFDWQAFAGEYQHLSLFSTQRILDIEIPNGKPGDAGSRAIQAYCDTLPPDNIVIIRMPKLPAASLNSRWVKSIDAAGVLLIIYPLDKNLPQWLAQRAKSKGLNLSAESISWLAEHTENNALAAAQEIEKLVLCFGENSIKHEEVIAAVANQSRYDSFQLIDAALKKEKNSLPLILNAVKQSGEAPSLILWALTRELRTLSQIAFHLAKGENFPTLCQRFGVWSTRQALIQQALNGRKTAFFHKALLQCQKIDAMIKGQERGDYWDALLDILLRLGYSK